MSPDSPRFPHAREPHTAARLTAPAVVLFDWHATLVDTQDAMYRAVDGLLTELDALGLDASLKPAAEAVMTGDGRLRDYVQRERRLPPEVKAARRVSRTDLFEIRVGRNEIAKEDSCDVTSSDLTPTACGFIKTSVRYISAE